MRLRQIAFLVVFSLLGIVQVDGQSPNGTISGLVVDPSGAAIVGAEIVIANDATGVQYPTKTNAEGMYLVPNLPPGTYRLQVSEIGFKTIIKPEIVIHVQDALAINFTLPIGAASEVVTVQGGAPLINTENAAVSTVIDRQFAENLPMNGRSIQTLIQLTPGVVLSASSSYDSGQFSINGQRPSSNYWMVDGVGANIGVSALGLPGNGFGGTVGSFSALGGTNSLVSVDALQEFRIQTSTYAPEFGRTPGGQISIVTRPGTKQFHGTVFDFFRNNVLDANDWFADSAGLSKPEERQNDFGGTFSGPVMKDGTFFFFSYEGLRLRLPQVALDTVPDLSARLNATPAIQPYLNAFPLPSPNGTDNMVTGVALLSASYSNKATLDAYSLRVDHKLGGKWSLFGRYSYSPSGIIARGASSSALSVLQQVRVTTQTATGGATRVISPIATNDLRFNYSRTNASSHFEQDNFGGAVPITSSPLPTPFTAQDSGYSLLFLSLTGPSLAGGRILHALQRQINVIDSLSVQKGSHSLKFGVDFRRLSPLYGPRSYFQQVNFGSVSQAEKGMPGLHIIFSGSGATLLFRNLGVYAQDTWRVVPRLTVTYGLRWDVDLAPSSLEGPSLPAVNGFNLSNLSNLALAPAGTSPFNTRYGNVAPRVGAAYQISQSQDWQTVLRGGFGIFYDLASSEVGNMLPNAGYPFSARKFGFGGTFPLDSASAAPPPITPAGLAPPFGVLTAFDPNMKLPYTLEWNVAFEQAMGKQQTVSASYIGAAGRRLIQTAFVSTPNPNIGSAWLVANAATSDYSALQLQYQRRLSYGLQALASYTWSHSIDEASAGSFNNNANGLVPNLDASVNRGPSDFDIRNAFSAGVTYDVPASKINAFTNAILRGWSVQNIIQAHSAPPVNVSYESFTQLNGATTAIRPDLVSGIPLYLYGSQYPGGKIINNTVGAVARGCAGGSQSRGPFCLPPTDANGIPSRQGDLGRNALRGFGATQWDLAAHRDFPIRESLKLQFRTELFNVLNHPNFGLPVPFVDAPNFGQATQMLGQSLNQSNLGGGAFNPLYQIGGPRSIQLALKLLF